MKIGLDGSLLPEMHEMATPVKAGERLKSEEDTIFFSPLFLQKKVCELCIVIVFYVGNSVTQEF